MNWLAILQGICWWIYGCIAVATMHRVIYGRGSTRMRFVWYDIWVGFYIDRHRGILYICPLPMWLIELRDP